MEKQDIIKIKQTDKDIPVSKQEYKKNCGDCGRFVPRDRWIKIDDPLKYHPLCLDCYSLYDDPAYM